MNLKTLSDLHSFLAAYSTQDDADLDVKTAQDFAANASAEKQQRVIAQAKEFSSSASIVEELGMETNRWFGDADEAKEWLEKIVSALQSNADSDSVVVKDSNGAVLAEGDAVTVIKDLKVKGGSSDLKRGTLIKKVHLIGDPENIECNVNGSTLVLKTCFLKKA